MSRPGFAGKVGLFVAIGLVLLAALVTIFSKGSGLFARTYELRLRANSLSGLQQGSIVLMAGVPVGTVEGAQLTVGGKEVIIRLKIDRRFRIHGDARFVIEQIGFLGDQYVAIYPQQNAAPILQEGDTVAVEVPLSMQSTVRSATELIEELNKTAKTINGMVSRIDQTLLSEASLTNAESMVKNFRLVSERVLDMVEDVNRLVETNSRPIFVSVSNLVEFSQALDILAQELTETVASNKVELMKAAQSLSGGARSLERLVIAVDQGEGLAGALIRDPKLKTNLQHTIQNLATVSSNISRYGLLYKPKKVKTNEVRGPFYEPKSPFR